MIRNLILSSYLLFFGASTAQAFGLVQCTNEYDRPKPPACIAYYVGFTDEADFSICRSDIEIYLRKSKDYAQCLSDLIGEVSAENKKMVDRFNCIANHLSPCL